MSRGPGRVQRRIKELMQSEPSGAWTVEDLCDRVFEDAGQVKKKHRVSVIRALRTVVVDDPDWQLWVSGGRGGTLILVNHSDIMSYALARLKEDSSSYYRQNDSRVPAHWKHSEQDLLEKIATDHSYLIEPGGVWHLNVAQHIAERDGDTDTANGLRKQQAVARAKVMAGLRGRR